MNLTTFKTIETESSFDALNPFAILKPQVNQQQELNPKEASEIASDQIMKIIREQFEKSKKEFQEKQKK